MKAYPITINPQGQAEWTQQDGDSYLATGVDRNGKRFRIVSYSWSHIRQLNLWRGNKWLIRNGRKYLIQSVMN